MAILTTMRIDMSFDEENLLKILHNFCEALQTKDFEIKNSVIENTFSEYFRFNNFNEFKDALRKSIADIMVRKSNDRFTFYNSDRETGAYTAIIKLHTKTDASVSKELLSILNNAILDAHPSTFTIVQDIVKGLLNDIGIDTNNKIYYEKFLNTLKKWPCPERIYDDLYKMLGEEAIGLKFLDEHSKSLYLGAMSTNPKETLKMLAKLKKE